MMYTNKDYKETMKCLNEYANRPLSRREAFNSLYRGGFINKDGSLPIQYGGEYTDEDHPAFMKDKD